MKKPSLFLLAAPPLLAGILLLAGSLFPLRLDCRTLQHLTKFEGLDKQLAGATQIIYLSHDNGFVAGQMATFTLRHLAFPDAGRIWLTLAENHAGEWWGEWIGVDARGSYFAPGRPPPTLVPAMRPAGLDLQGSKIVCDSHDVFSEFQKRIPSLSGADNIIFLDGIHGSSGFVFSFPHSDFSPVRIFRLCLILGAILSCTLIMASRSGTCGIGVGFVGGIALQIWLASLSWQAWPFLLAAQWAGGIFFLRNEPPITFPRLTNSVICLATVAGISLFVFLVRLDFDGDVITHWLPMARSFYHLGHHDPTSLLAQGSIHAATYPPGYGIFLAMTMWAADMKTLHSFLPGADSSLAIFYYRLIIWLLNLAFLGLLSGLLIRLSARHSLLWLVGLALVIGIIPTVRGTHIGAETLLFPILGSALILMLSGPTHRRQPRHLSNAGGMPAVATVEPHSPLFLLAGVFIAGVALLIKAEVFLLIAGVLIPWYLALLVQNPAMRSPRSLFMLSFVGMASIVPAILWKSGMHIDNGFFNHPSLHAAWAGRAEWGFLLATSLIFLFKSPLWIPFFLLLPAGWILSARQGFRWSTLLVPAATALLFLAFVSMYLFSNWPTKSLHIEQSLDRLLFLPALSCILYFLPNLAEDYDSPC